MRKRGTALAAAAPLLALGLAPTAAIAASVPAVAPAVLACRATPVVAGAWQGGFELEFVITNTGTEPFSAWTVTFDLPPGDTVYTTWNGSIQQSGNHVVATSYPSSSYNGPLPPGASTTGFGMVIGGNGGTAISNVTCTPGQFPSQ